MPPMYRGATTSGVLSSGLAKHTSIPESFADFIIPVSSVILHFSFQYVMALIKALADPDDANRPTVGMSVLAAIWSFPPSFSTFLAILSTSSTVNVGGPHRRHPLGFFRNPHDSTNSFTSDFDHGCRACQALTFFPFSSRTTRGNFCRIDIGCQQLTPIETVRVWIDPPFYVSFIRFYRVSNFVFIRMLLCWNAYL